MVVVPTGFAMSLCLREARLLCSLGEYSVLPEGFPEIVECLVGVETERAFSYAPERPAAAFQVALARCVRLVAVRAMPNIAIALDGQTSIDSLHYEVDPVTGHLELRYHSVSAPGDAQEHI